MSNDDLVKKIFECDEGLTWEQRLDFLLKAVNDISKSLNEAAQSSKLLHTAIGEHNELLTTIFYLISYHLYDGVSEKSRLSLKDLMCKVKSKSKEKDTNDEKTP